MKVIKTPSGLVFKYVESVDEDKLPRGYTVEDFEGLSNKAKTLIQMLETKGFKFIEHSPHINPRLTACAAFSLLEFNNLAKGNWDV